MAARMEQLAPPVITLIVVVGTEVALPLLQAIAEAPEAEFWANLRHLQATEFLYETGLFSDMNTPSSMPSRMRWRIGVSCKSAGAPCTGVSWRPWSGAIPTAWVNIWNNWPIMRLAARSGPKRCCTTVKPGPKRYNTRASARR
jgi:hypothetical protein